MDWDGLTEAFVTAHPGSKVSQMFGAPCVKRDSGKVVFCFWQGDVVFKLVDEDARAGALGLDGATLFDPGMGRTMKEWVLVPTSHSDRWLELATKAFAGA
jgi:hypothetical protein